MRGIRSLNNLSKRCYAAARPNEALTESDTGYKSSGVSLPAPQNVQVSKLPNGLVIASLENYSPLSTVGVFVKAGSRYESVENQGVAHVLRLAANLTTKGVSAFKLCRGVEALGANLSAALSRETMVYTARCFRDYLDNILEYLVNVTMAQEFRPWEVCDLTSRVIANKDRAKRAPQCTFGMSLFRFLHSGVIEKLHEAAYKNTLSNSLYCPEHMVGKVSPQQLHSFVEDHFTTGRMAVVGLGVKHSDLTELSKRFLSVRVGAGAPLVQATYRGGELRVQNQDSQVHALVVSEGGVAGGTEATAFAVLQKILGVEPHVKRGTGITSKLSQGVTKASAFNASYSDSGLFGVYTISQANVARDAIRVAIAQVGSVAEGTVTEDDITRAKIQAKVDYLLSTESSDGLMAEIGAQALETAAYRPPEAVLQAIDAVTQEHVVKAARKFMDGKKTMAACGHLINTPFLDEL
ncbi:ubiquinol-cytochrome c reductase core protein 2a isoform X3 [Syngnathus scovelli]|uniref:ubiquinol-cytochrome c reductase core protein 2a isoform X3 n=1 Tax=Syngnathus scovelli TaxID=161590 RepID=UPI00210F947B|nr:cytochrome b-c1 complex subunit 2, mitochondrial isoform X3 [Syngnathus scovelli]